MATLATHVRWTDRPALALQIINDSAQPRDLRDAELRYWLQKTASWCVTHASAPTQAIGGDAGRGPPCTIGLLYPVSVAFGTQWPETTIRPATNTGTRTRG
jgi:hypothetical protein